MMRRREFLHSGLALAAGACYRWAGAETSDRAAKIVTVAGPVAADELGPTLPHEHVLVDFVGADRVSRDRYDPDEVFRVMLPHLERAREAGCRTIFECTPAYLGRDPALLRRLSEASGVRLVTNTGYYGAANRKFLPGHAHRESADELAARWIAEWRDGIQDTGLRPGFIKIGVDAGPLPDVNRKLVEAAARTHLATGLTIAAHTGDGRAALEQLDILGQEGVAPAAWIWVHAQNERNADVHLAAARRGAWVEFDGVGPDSIQRHVELASNLRRHGLLDRVLVSHDAGWYHVGEAGGGNVRPFDTLFTKFLPALKNAGFTDDNVRLLTERNPAKAFAISVRRRGDVDLLRCPQP